MNLINKIENVLSGIKSGQITIISNLKIINYVLTFEKRGIYNIQIDNFELLNKVFSVFIYYKYHCYIHNNKIVITENVLVKKKKLVTIKTIYKNYKNYTSIQSIYTDIRSFTIPFYKYKNTYFFDEIEVNKYFKIKKLYKYDMINIIELQKFFKNKLSIEDILNKTKKEFLPYFQYGNEISFSIEEVETWMKQTGFKLD